jgi:nucleoside-diphosphate-sugar epimerase
MRILIIGGSQFIGKALLKEFLGDPERHEITVFNRGNNEMFDAPSLKWYKGDRTLGFGQLVNSRFDLIIDTCAFKPTDLIHINQLSFEKYILISSTAVYEPLNFGAINENSILKKVQHISDLSDTDLMELPVNDRTYGPLKILTEQKIKSLTRNSIIIRPCVVLGQHENTNRLKNLFKLVSNSTSSLISSSECLNFQYIDVFDLAKLVLKISKSNNNGTYNLCAPPIKWNSFIKSIIELLNSKLELSEIDESLGIPFFKYSKELGGSFYSSNHREITQFNFSSIKSTLLSYQDSAIF